MCIVQREVSWSVEAAQPREAGLRESEVAANFLPDAPPSSGLWCLLSASKLLFPISPLCPCLSVVNTTIEISIHVNDSINGF